MQDHEKLTYHLRQQSIDAIDKIVDWVWIAVKNETQIDNQLSNIDLVYNDLSAWTDMKVFKRDEIPDSYHIKNADYALDLLIIPRLESVQDFLCALVTKHSNNFSLYHVFVVFNRRDLCSKFLSAQIRF